jgi:hypothetical protein
MSDGDPTIIRYGYQGTEINPVNAILERVAKTLEEFMAYRASLDKMIQALGSDGVNQTAVRGSYSAADFRDAGIVVQMAQTQMPLPVQAAPIAASVYRPTGIIAATTGIQVLGTTTTEINVNTTNPSVVSSSASDVDGGTGCSQILIQYYDQSLSTGPEFLIVGLNGLTAVNLDVLLPSPLCYVEAIYGLAFGSTGAAVGDIQLWSGLSGTGTLIGAVSAGDTQSQWGRHYIPSGMTSYVTDVGFALTVAGIAGGSVSAVFNFNSGVSGDANTASYMPVTGYLGGMQGANGYFSQPIPVQGPAKLQMRAWTSVVTGNLYGTFGCYDVPSSDIPDLQSSTLPGNPTFPPSPLVTV